MEGLEIPTLVGEEGVLRAGLVGGVDSARVLGKDGVNETETELDEEGTRAGVVLEKGKTSSWKMTSREINMRPVSGW